MFDSDEFENVFGKEYSDEAKDTFKFLWEELETEMNDSVILGMLYILTTNDVEACLKAIFLSGAWFALEKGLENPIISKEENDLVDSLLENRNEN